MLFAVPQPAKENEKKEKPMYLKDYEMQQLLERGAMAGVSDSEEEEAKNKEVKRVVLHSSAGFVMYTMVHEKQNKASNTPKPVSDFRWVGFQPTTLCSG